MMLKEEKHTPTAVSFEVVGMPQSSDKAPEPEIKKRLEAYSSIPNEPETREDIEEKL